MHALLRPRLVVLSPKAAVAPVTIHCCSAKGCQCHQVLGQQLDVHLAELRCGFFRRQGPA